jgi:anti-anti-sigma factor
VGSSTNGSSFSWTIDAKIPISSIALVGDFDLKACESIADLEKSVPGRTTGVLLDLSEVSFIDSTGLRRLMQIKQGLRKRDVRLFLGKMSPVVKNVLDLSGVDGFFEFANGHSKSWWQRFKQERARKRV